MIFINRLLLISIKIRKIPPPLRTVVPSSLQMFNSKKNASARTKSDRIASLINGESQSEEQVFEVDSILDKKTKHGVDYYLVSWKNYPVSDATWQPKSNMTNCNSLILQYELTHLPNQAKADLEEAYEEDKPFKQPADPIPPNIYTHNIDCLKENSTVSSFNSILSFLDEKIRVQSCLGDELAAEIIGSEIENQGEAPTWFRIRLENGELRRTQRQQLLKKRENKRKLIEYYETLIHWN